MAKARSNYILDYFSLFFLVCIYIFATQLQAAVNQVQTRFSDIINLFPIQNKDKQLRIITCPHSQQHRAVQSFFLALLPLLAGSTSPSAPVALYLLFILTSYTLEQILKTMLVPSTLKRGNKPYPSKKNLAQSPSSFTCNSQNTSLLNRKHKTHRHNSCILPFPALISHLKTCLHTMEGNKNLQMLV